LESEVQCSRQQMHEMRPFPVPDHHNVLQKRFFARVNVGVCRARCCALSLAPGPGENCRVDSTRVSKLKLRGKATEPAQNPLIQIMMEVCNHTNGGSLFQFGCQGIQQLWWTMSRERSREVQGTNKHATMLPSRQHIEKTIDL
jgi:hypothetical protein